MQKDSKLNHFIQNLSVSNYIVPLLCDLNHILPYLTSHKQPLDR